MLRRLHLIELFVALLCFGLTPFSKAGSDPLRVFIRAGRKTHGPGQHDHPRFLREWKALLNERGLRADGGTNFPSALQLENTDVLLIYAADGATIQGSDRANLEKFLQRGGGLIVLHDAIVGNDPQWFKTIVGGAWENGHAKWYEGEVAENFVDNQHPITRGMPNFEWKDEIYYQLHMMPDAHALATSSHDNSVIAAQMWVYEKTLAGSAKPYRAFCFDSRSRIHVIRQAAVQGNPDARNRLGRLAGERR